MSQEKYYKECQRWFSQAKSDFKAARDSLGSEHYEWSCFQAQQAAEKALKAVWYYIVQDPWGHSVVKLIDDLPDAKMKTALLEFLDNAKELDKLYIPTRYPNGLPELTPAEVYTKTEAARAISAAEKIISAAGQIISGGANENPIS